MAKVEKVEKKRRERFEVLATELPGVELKAEPEVKLDILKRTTDFFYKVTRQFAATYFQIQEVITQQDGRREEIISIAEEHKGLRGLNSEKDNFSLTVSPREGISWNRQLLKKGLGIAYSILVSEELVVSISIPLGFTTKKRITITEELVKKIIEEALLSKLGISQQDFARMVSYQTNVKVNGEKMAEMINQGKVKQLPAGAKTSQIVWQVGVDRLKK